jgi:hypothetical protein
MQSLDEVHELVRGHLSITTNVTTPEGVKIAIAWAHKDPQGFTAANCLVLGDSLDEALRKVVLLEEDFNDAPTDS